MHAFFPAWRGLCMLCSYSAYMTPRIKTAFTFTYTHEAGAASAVTDSRRARRREDISLACHYIKVAVWRMWKPEHATLLHLRDTQEHQSWGDCGTQHLSKVSHEINPNAMGGSLVMRLEHSMERVPGSAKRICDCFFAAKFNHISSSFISPCSAVFMGHSSLFFVKLSSGLTITVDSHWLPAE